MDQITVDIIAMWLYLLAVLCIGMISIGLTVYKNELKFNWNCKPGGGIFAGIHYSFPIVVVNAGESNCWYSSIRVGFGLFNVTLISTRKVSRAAQFKG